MARKHRGKRAEGGFIEEGPHDVAKDSGNVEEDKQQKSQLRKHGGKVHGKPSKHRPDRRARGGAVGADDSPYTTAKNMKLQPFEKNQQPDDDHGEGADKRIGKK